MKKYPEGEPITSGRTAEIFAWEEGHILKLFHDWYPISAVEQETRIAHTIHAAGLPIPEARDVLFFGDRLGIVYERIEGNNMFAVIQENPLKVFNLMKILAQLHKNIHQCAVPELPSYKEQLDAKISSAYALPVSMRRAIRKILKQLPDGEHLCHGDFHPGNIIMTESRPVVIDWNAAGQGSPLADVARTHFLLTSALPPEGDSLPLFFSITRKWLGILYMKNYKLFPSAERVEFPAWKLVITAARITEEVPGEEKFLIKTIQKELKRRGII
ncbi:MAG: phosphotransferase [Anaerolineaceae bacterium]|nr:phosphotransferase [Anaerolineaceae bacterium]